MATIGLRIQDNPDVGSGLSLADTLAKGVFGDPEAQMKARLLASQVAAHQAYSTKLGADTGLVNVKTREEQALADAQDAAAKSPDALIAAVPSPAQPIPVEAPRANAPGTTGYGPQPGIVTPDAQATYDAGVRMHDAQVATLRNLWPVIVRSGNATQVIEALGKGEGLGALSGGLVPGAKVDPNVQRVAGGIYTGTAPTTGTVWSPGDIAGQQAEAGKDIAVERARPVKPDIREIGGGLVRVDASGAAATPVQGAEPQPKAPERQVVDGAVYERQPNGTWAPATGIAPPAPTPPKVQNVGKNETPYVINPDGSVSVAKGFQPPEKGAGGPFGDLSSEGGRALAFIGSTASKVADPNAVISPDEARNYALAWNQQYGARTQIVTDPQGNPHYVPIQPDIPPGLPSPTEVFKRAGMPVVPSTPQTLQTPQTSQTAPPTAPPVVGPDGQSAAPPAPPLVPPEVFPNTPKPPNQQQSQARNFATRALSGTEVLDKMTPDNIPNAVLTALATSQGNPGVLNSIIQSNLPDSAKQYAQAVAAFTSAQLRRESGAAINASEYQYAYKTFIPLPGDSPKLLATKAAARHDFIRNLAQEGYGNDNNAQKAFFDDATKRGVQLSNAPAASDPNDQPPPGVDPKVWKHMPPEDRKLFNR